ncbi:MAG: T9SS type A sorting domain-containing protein [Bacteroidetes bacterium]|nr:T9SS type A sorting domain-containing protein [Bacteroidota bacterium]
MKTKLLTIKIAVVALGLFISTSANAAFTAVTSGNWSSAATWGGIAPTATVTNQDIIIPAGITVTLDADVTFVGLLNNFSVAGILTSTTSNGVSMAQGALAGGGTISINRISFTSLATCSFSGNLNLKRMSNSTTALAFSAIANIADTLDLQSGNLLLNTNANLTMLSNSTVKVNNGSITVGGGIFNSGNAYNVMYIGPSKTTGIELNSTTIQHLYLTMNDNTQGVTLNNNTTVNGNTTVNSGKIILNGKQFIMKGNITLSAGSTFAGSAASIMEIDGSGSLNSSLYFDAGSTLLNDLIINRSANGQVKLGNSLNIGGHLKLMNGNFSIESGAILTMSSASTVHIENGNLALNTGTFNGTAPYNVEYMGVSDNNTGPELTGSGLNNLTVSYTSSQNKITLSNNAVISGNLNMNKGNVKLNGKTLTLNGTISQNSSSTFMGDASAELYLNLTSVTNDTLFFDAFTLNQTLNRLRVNLTQTATIVLGNKLYINTELAFIKGKVELTNSDLVIMPSAAITGYDDSNYIVTSQNNSGNLSMNVNAGSAYVTFPIGTSSNYSPAHIQQASAAGSGNFNVKAMNTVLSGGTYGFVNSNTLKVVNRTWLVSSAVSTINANLKFGWVAAAEVNGFNRTNAYVSHYTSSAWDVMSAGSASIAANNTYELARMNMTSLSPFAVTEAGQALKVKENSISNELEVYPNPSKDVVSVKLLNATDNYKYELTDITGRTISTNINSNNVNKFDVSNLVTGCYFIKITNLSDNKTVTKRFVKE